MTTAPGIHSRMPLLFLGHGNPMNAIAENIFVNGFRNIAKELPKPRAVLCISAHWETNGTFVTATDKPRTIHDFSGFPEALYNIQYPADGCPELAEKITHLASGTEIRRDYSWGLDHGTWTVLKHIYPDADVPVVQLSLDRSKGPQYHYDLAKHLAPLRDEGILIAGSGNIVHNLSMIAWNRLDEDEYGYDWAIQAGNEIRQFIQNDDHQALINYKSHGKPFMLAVPTPEHYLPMLYIIALKNSDEKIYFFNDKPTSGSLDMTSFKIRIHA